MQFDRHRDIHRTLCRPVVAVSTLCLLLTAGCTSTTPRWANQPWRPLPQQPAATADPGAHSGPGPVGPATDSGTPVTTARPPRVQPVVFQETVRAQDEGYATTPRYPLNGQSGVYVPPAANPGQIPAQPPAGQAPYGTQYSPTRTYQIPDDGANPPLAPPPQVSPYFDPVPSVPDNFADIDVMLQEAQTGRMTFGAAYNSNSGLVGQIIIDERNFDIGAFPRSLDDVISGRAWRGGGQGFRLELVPGNEVQRYALSFDEPYLFNSDVSFSASGYYFDRQYFDWSEQRLGGRLALGYRLTPDLSLSVGLRMENVNVFDPRVNTSPELNASLGNNGLYLGSVRLINDTRDHPFMATEGSYLELAYHQAFGDYSYPRGEVDFRKYFLIYQRPDLSGRHTLSFQTRLGFSGSDTPVFENYFAGGFSTLRGFAFRGASPVQGGVRVGGEFQWLNTAEYVFPITADDMFKGVLFCDYGTVEPDVRLDADTFRVAPGFGFRVHMPVGGAGGAPLAFDFAFPVNKAPTDDTQVFSFYMGVLR